MHGPAVDSVSALISPLCATSTFLNLDLGLSHQLSLESGRSGAGEKLFAAGRGEHGIPLNLGKVRNREAHAYLISVKLEILVGTSLIHNCTSIDFVATSSGIDYFDHRLGLSELDGRE